MNKNILIIVFIIVLIGGGLVWVFNVIDKANGPVIITEAEDEEEDTKDIATTVSVSLSGAPNFNEFILLQENNQENKIYSIEQWHKWAEENWDKLVPEPILIYDGLIEIRPERIRQFGAVILSPKKDKIIFSSHDLQMDYSPAIICSLCIDTKEVSLITITPETNALIQIAVSPQERYLAYVTFSAQDGSDAINIENIRDKRQIINFGYEILNEVTMQVLDKKLYSWESFFPMFGDLEWSIDGEKLYFTTKEFRADDETKIRWVINTDGTGLELLELSSTE